MLRRNRSFLIAEVFHFDWQVFFSFACFKRFVCSVAKSPIIILILHKEVVCLPRKIPESS